MGQSGLQQVSGTPQDDQVIPVGCFAVESVER